MSRRDRGASGPVRSGVVRGLATVLTARALAIGLGVVMVVGLATGCSGGDEPDAGPSSAPLSPSEVGTQVSFGKVAGRLPGAERDRLAAEVRSVVDGWFEAAYLGGDYPRTDFADAWPGFTTGAAAKAKRDAGLMSNQDIGADVDGIEPIGRALRIDVLAARRKPVGVTAHVRLRFDTTGEPAKRVRVGGRLFLTEVKQGWRVFGYDITKGVVR